MKTRIPALFLLLISWVAGIGLLGQSELQGSPIPAPPVSDTVRVLFIGNSYTYYNDLPSMVERLASSEGSPSEVYAESVTAGGATLQRLWEGGGALEAIRNGGWDFVVLQEQSTRPLQDPERMHEFARAFALEINRNGAETVFFLTWARQARPETQPGLNRAYLTIARELRAKVAPVGPAWKVALDLSPEIPLHAEDGSHPTPTGSYLAACVFFGLLVDDQLACPPAADPVITQGNAAVARRAASRVLSEGRR